jgi:hypothetical protein
MCAAPWQKRSGSTTAASSGSFSGGDHGNDRTDREGDSGVVEKEKGNEGEAVEKENGSRKPSPMKRGKWRRALPAAHRIRRKERKSAGPLQQGKKEANT